MQYSTVIGQLPRVSRENYNEAIQRQTDGHKYWPAPSIIQRGLEWSQWLKRLFVLCGLQEKNMFDRLIYRIGQLPRVSREDPERIRVDSVFETCVLYLFIYLLANSLVYPERIQRGIEWTQFLKRLFFLYLLVSKFSHFPSFNLLFLYSTVQKSAVQYRYLFGASIL